MLFPAEQAVYSWLNNAHGICHFPAILKFFSLVTVFFFFLCFSNRIKSTYNYLERRFIVVQGNPRTNHCVDIKRNEPMGNHWYSTTCNWANGAARKKCCKGQSTFTGCRRIKSVSLPLSLAKALKIKLSKENAPPSTPPKKKEPIRAQLCRGKGSVYGPS